MFPAVNSNGTVSPTEMASRAFVEAGALADSGDAVATLVAFGVLPRRLRGLVLGSTAGAAVTGAALARALQG